MMEWILTLWLETGATITQPASEMHCYRIAQTMEYAKAINRRMWVDGPDVGFKRTTVVRFECNKSGVPTS